MPRPKTSIPFWAQQILFAEPGKPFDGKPTRIKPGGSKIVKGFLPTERPPGEFLNWVLGVLCDHALHNDGVEVQNFWPGAEVSVGTIQLTANQSLAFWDPITRNFWIGGAGYGAAPSKILRSNDGLGFVDVSATVGAPEIKAMASDGQGNMIACEDLNLYNRTPGAAETAWTSHAMGANQVIKAALWDDESGTFALFGSSNTFPAVFKVTPGMTITLTATVTNAGPLAGEIEYAAVTTGRKVMIGTRNGVWKIWTATAIDGVFSDAGDFSTLLFGFGTPVALTYDGETGLFVVADSHGGIGVSTNGSVWTSIQDPLAGSFDVQPNCLACNGSAWIAVVKDTTLPATMTNQLRVVYDLNHDGSAWVDVPYPFAQDVPPFSVTVGDGRFTILAQKTNQIWAAHSTRLK